MSQTTRKVRCRNCNCTQSFENAVCNNCGADLMLYGEVLRDTPSITAGKTTGAAARAAGIGARKVLTTKLAIKITAAVLAGAVTVGTAAVVIGGEKNNSNPNPTNANPVVTEPAVTPDPGNSGVTPAPTGTSNPGAPTTVVGEMDLNYFNQIPENAVPDMYYWGDGRVTYMSEPNENKNNVHQYIAEESVADRYIDMLQNNGFTLVGTHVQSYKGESHYSWGFDCDAVPNAERITLMYEDTPCHISFYFSEKPGKYRMDVSPDLLVCDTGLRYDGSVADLSPRGPSAGAGLVMLDDGSFQTSDGRLTASLGTATILRDGVEYRANARYDAEDGEEAVIVENYYRNEGLYFQAPKASLMQGDVFTQREMLRWRWPEFTSIGSLQNHALGQNPFLILPYNGYWQGASHNETVYEAQTARVMYYDSGDIGVFYFYVKFLKGEPREVEALCAVSMAERRGNIDDAIYVKAGNVATVKYGHHEYGTTRENYDWVILEGADKISIRGVGDTCDVTCDKPGVAAVQVTYGYTKQEPDVLTGIMRTVGHSKIQVYYFIIE